MSNGIIRGKPNSVAPLFFRSDYMEDKVNHPSHYETDGIQCIDAMVAAQGADAVKEFCVCNAFKYIWRFRHKNGIEDIKKAAWYLNKYVELSEPSVGEIVDKVYDTIDEGGESNKAQEKREHTTWNDSLKSDMFACGNCGAYLDVADGNSGEFKEPTYCPECGCRVDENYWRFHNAL